MAVSASGRRGGVCLFSLSENLPLMTLIYADTSLLVSRYFFAFAHTFNHCHLEREWKHPEYASLSNAASRRSHENVSTELPVLVSTTRSPSRSRPNLRVKSQPARRSLLTKKKTPVLARELSQVQNRNLELNQIRRAV